jgi:PAS domain S-box-containing protein
VRVQSRAELGVCADDLLTASYLASLPNDLILALPAAIYTTDAQGRITAYNDAAVALWGCRPELGKSEFCGSWKLYWPDGTPLPHDECPMALALEQKRPIRGMEAVAERPDGSRVAFIPYPTPLFDDAGTLVGAVNMLVDISDRKNVENAVARHKDEQAALYRFTDRLFRATKIEDVYQGALEAIRATLGSDRASVLLFDASRAMRFVAWVGLSEGYRRAVDGHSPWTRDATDPPPICIPDISTSDLPDALKATILDEGIRAAAFIPLFGGGRLIGKFMAYYNAPRVLADDDIHLAITIARQLGFGIERIGAEADRRRADQTNKLLASIVETSDDAIISKDLNGILTSWNQGAERIFGYTADEMIGRSIMTLIPPDRVDEEPQIIERLRRGERIDHYETVRQRKDGTLVDISLTVSPVVDAAGKVVGASKIARDITERRQLQDRQDMIAREVAHRTKNLFAVVQAVVARSFIGKTSVEDAQAVIINRIVSLGQTHALLIDKDWQGADLAELVHTEMRPFGDRVHIDGPGITLTAKAAQNFALAVHELATNAAKYGALSTPMGHVSIRWSVTAKADGNRFRFLWEEQGGPPVSPPVRKGFGSTVLEQLMSEYFDPPPRIDYASHGLRYEAIAPLESLSDSDGPQSDPMSP